jgi:hypothetical protein
MMTKLYFPLGFIAGALVMWFFLLPVIEDTQEQSVELSDVMSSLSACEEELYEMYLRCPGKYHVYPFLEKYPND